MEEKRELKLFRVHGERRDIVWYFVRAFDAADALHVFEEDNDPVKLESGEMGIIDDAVGLDDGYFKVFGVDEATEDEVRQWL